MKKALTYLFFFLYCKSSWATHIVGGDIKYTFLGGQSYEVIVTVYRDCNSNTNFDGLQQGNSPAFTLGLIEEGQFASTATYNVVITNSDITPVYSSIRNPCLDTPTNICVQYATYKKVINVPNPNKAYYLIYQRCCRNNSIVNVVPAQTTPSLTMPGATYITRIPPTNTYQNSSAVFAKFPPKFICKGVQFTYNHSASDPDGDSLSYELYTPYLGLDGSAPSTTAPTLDTAPITWKAPYSLSNVLGGTPLSIDQNGVLTCTPNTIGQFVVGVRVNEWRNGVKINSVNRDFQFNVSSCNGPIASVPQKAGTIDAKTGIGFFDINCESFTVNFTNTSSGASKYKWNFGDPVSGANNTSTATTPSHTYSDTGTYNVTLIAINYIAASDSCADTFRTKVAIYPYFYVGYTKNEVCEDSFITFIDTSSHRYGTITNWSWTFGDGGTSAIRFPKHKYPDGGKYPVVLTVTTNRGCIKTFKDSALVYPDPVPNFNLPTPACVNTNIWFEDISTIVPGYSVTGWNWDFGTGATTNTKLANYVFNTPGNKTIRLISKSNKGCQDTIVKNLMVNPLPTIVATGTKTICWNASTPLNATGGISYKWIPGATLTDSLIPNPIATPNSYPNPQKYIVYGTDINNCVNKDSVLISFFTKPPVAAGPDTNVCLNKSNISYRDSVTLNATGAITYTWTPIVGLDDPNISNPKAKPKNNTLYVVEGTDINLCKAKDSVMVYVLDPALDLLPATDTFLCEFDTIKIRVLDQGIITKYLWSPTLGISDKNARNPFFFPIDTTQYILTVQNYCYNKADTIRIDVRKKPPIQLVKKDSICLYQTYQINAKGTGTFTWRPNKTLSTFNIANPIASPVQTTTYYVTLTDIYNCKNKDSLNLLVYPNPLVQIVTRPKYICQNIPYQIKVNSDNSYKFIWNPGYWLNDSTVKEPIVVAQDTQRYIVQATNFHGCIDRDTIDLNVQKPVVPMAPSPVHICKNSFLFVEASGGFYYRWSPGYMINDTMNKRAQIYVDRDTVYKVYIANDCFIDSTNVQVIIDSLTDLQAATDTTIFRGSSVKLSVLGDGKEEWHPNYMIDDVFSKTPTVNPIYSTKYYVKSIGKNGCVSFDSVTVRVVGKTILLLPTGFSPNGDGVNDLFGIIQYLNIEKINSFDIYDRWGEKVFTTTDIKAKWDGSFNGEKMPIGTYVWYIDAQTYDGEKVQQKGNITLLR